MPKGALCEQLSRLSFFFLFYEGLLEDIRMSSDHVDMTRAELCKYAI